MDIADRIVRAARLALDALAPPPPEPAATARSDQRPSLWQNERTGQGTIAGDRSVWTVPTTVHPIAEGELAALWMQDPIAGIIIDAIVEDGMRDGFRIVYGGESEADLHLVDDVRLVAEELRLELAVSLAAKSVRALGGGGVLPIVNGGAVLREEPIAIERVVSVDRLVVVDRRDLRPLQWIADEVEYFTYAPARLDTATHSAARLHRSHLVMFPGADTPSRDRQNSFEGWSRPVLQRVIDRIQAFQGSWGSATAMLQNGSMGVLKVPDLWSITASKGRAVFEKMLAEIQRTMWVARIFPISTDEEFAFAERTYAGVADLLRESQPLIAMAADMPITRLFGVSPAGMDATGVSDERQWISKVAHHRRACIMPPAVRLVRMIAKAAGARDWMRWGIEWPDLEVITTAERMAIEKLTAETDALRIASGMPAASVLLHRYGSGEYLSSPPRLSEEAVEAIGRMLDLELEGLASGDPEGEPEEQEQE